MLEEAKPAGWDTRARYATFLGTAGDYMHGLVRSG